MVLDPAAYLGTVTRVVEDTERDGKPAKVVIASRRYPTDPADLWHALTDPERLPRWFLPITGELKRGGRYQLEGNAGGTITRCEPPTALAVTWEIHGDVSWVDVELLPEQDGTRLTLRHTAHPHAGFWTQFGPGATGVGWDLSFLGLAQHVASPDEALDPAAFEAWTVSPAGKDIVGALSADWGRAAIANGAAEDQALAAAARTRAFYTGEAAPEG